MTECLFVKGQWGTQTNTPLRPNINKLFCERSSNFDLWLLLIILWTLWSKSMLYATQGSRPDRAQPYIPHTQRGLWVQAGTCGTSHTNTHKHTHSFSIFIKLCSGFFGLCTACRLYGPLLLSWPTGWQSAQSTDAKVISENMVQQTALNGSFRFIMTGWVIIYPCTCSVLSCLFERECKLKINHVPHISEQCLKTNKESYDIFFGHISIINK